MRHFGLIGEHLEHSFSKKFFTAKFKAEEIAADYQLFELSNIETINELIAKEELAGFNVTIPYKQSIIPLLDEVTDTAREVGAVNCVKITDGKKVGYNTDVKGIETTLGWLDIKPETQALILGTGGASKAVQYVLRKNDIAFKVVSRDSSRGDITYNELTEEIIKEHELIINTTPLGMFPNVDQAPELNYEAIGEEHMIFELIYNPATTEFMRRCKERGANVMGGMMMLQTQAIASWHIWKESNPVSGEISPIIQ